MTGQALKIVLRMEDGSLRDHLPYAIWHNQKTGQITVHTETGYYKYPADAVVSIEMLQPSFAFTPEELDTYAKQREEQASEREPTPADVAAVSGMMFGYHQQPGEEPHGSAD